MLPDLATFEGQNGGEEKSERAKEVNFELGWKYWVGFEHELFGRTPNITESRVRCAATRVSKSTKTAQVFPEGLKTISLIIDLDKFGFFKSFGNRTISLFLTSPPQTVEIVAKRG